jgi:hypothetical protein
MTTSTAVGRRQGAAAPCERRRPPEPRPAVPGSQPAVVGAPHSGQNLLPSGMVCPFRHVAIGHVLQMSRVP